MTLKEQYQEYLKQHPNSVFLYNEWLEIFHPINRDIVWDNEEEQRDWDNTLTDGLDDLSDWEY